MRTPEGYRYFLLGVSRRAFVASMTLSVVMHIIVIVVIASGGFWQRKLLPPQPSYVVSLVDAPLTLVPSAAPKGQTAPKSRQERSEVNPDQAAELSPTPASPVTPAKQEPVAVPESSQATPASSLDRPEPPASQIKPAVTPQRQPQAEKRPPPQLPSQETSRAALAASSGPPERAAKPEPETSAPPPAPKATSAASQTPSRPPATETSAPSGTKAADYARQTIAQIRQQQAVAEAERRRAAQRITALRARVGVEGAGSDAANMAAGLRQVRLQAYQERVRAKIIDAWILPLAPSTIQGLEATALLMIDSEGGVTQFELLTPSGNVLFDQSLLRAIKQASPLPPLPEDYDGSFLEVEMRFKPHDS